MTSRVTRNVLSRGELLRMRAVFLCRAILSDSTRGSWGVRVEEGTASRDKEASPIAEPTPDTLF